MKNQMKRFVKGFKDFRNCSHLWGVFLRTPYDPNMEESTLYVNREGQFWSTVNHYHHLRGGWEKYPAWVKYEWEMSDDFEYDDFEYDDDEE